MSERRSLFRGLWRGIDTLRRLILNVLVFGLILSVLVAAWLNRPRVPGSAALVLRPEGQIVEQLSASDPVSRLAGRLSGAGARTSETLLKDLLDAIRQMLPTAVQEAEVLQGWASLLRSHRPTLLPELESAVAVVLAGLQGLEQDPPGGFGLIQGQVRGAGQKGVKARLQAVDPLQAGLGERAAGNLPAAQGRQGLGNGQLGQVAHHHSMTGGTRNWSPDSRTNGSTWPSSGTTDTSSRSSASPTRSRTGTAGRTSKG